MTGRSSWRVAPARLSRRRWRRMPSPPRARASGTHTLGVAAATSSCRLVWLSHGETPAPLTITTQVRKRYPISPILHLSELAYIRYVNRNRFGAFFVGQQDEDTVKTDSFQRAAIRYGGRVILVAAAYFITGRLGLLLAIPPGYATAVWPASGIALAANDSSYRSSRVLT